MTTVMGKYSTRIKSVLHQHQMTFCKNRAVEILLLDLPIFYLLLQDLTI